MSFLDEIKPAIFFARAMGIAPYKIDNFNIKISLCALFYSLMMHSVYVSSLWVKFFKTLIEGFVNKHENLTIIRASLPILSLMVSLVCLLLHHRRFSSFVRAVNNFDVMIKLSPVTKKDATVVWIIVLLPICICSSAAIFEQYVSGVQDFFEIWQFSKYIGLCSNICQYTTMVFCILRRFQEINRAIERGPKNVIKTIEFLRKTIGLRKIWILYDQLVDATEELNSMFSIQLFIWICTLSINIITRLYNIWNIFHTDRNQLVLDGGMILLWVLLLISLTGICHLTSSMANDVAANLFHVNSRILQSSYGWDNEDAFAIGQYFVLRRPLHFTAIGGFVRIDLPLLQTIFAAIMTYLVILISPSVKR